MQRLGLSALALSAMLATAAPLAAHANSYSFRYDFGSFDPGSFVTGSFNGDDLGGGLIGNLSNISVFVTKPDAGEAGVALDGPLTAWLETSCCGNFATSGGVASFNLADNNFVFIDAAQANDFYIIPWQSTTSLGVQVFQSSVSVDGGFINTDNRGVNTDGWTLTETSGGVPEPAAWALMIVGFGMAGATLRRQSLALS